MKMKIPNRGETITIPNGSIAYIRPSKDDRVTYQIDIDGDLYGCTEFGVQGQIFLATGLYRATGTIQVTKTIKTAK